MATSQPLRVLIFRHPGDTDAEAYEDAILRAFHGGKGEGPYLSAGDDLGVQVQIFSAIPADALPPSEMVDQFCHTLVLVFAGKALIEQSFDAFWDWLSQCSEHIRQSNKRHAMLTLAMEERDGRDFLKKRTSLGALQLLAAQTLGEFAVRPALYALRILHESRKVLSQGLSKGLTDGQSAGSLRLFISHAKIDGLPLAQALRYQIKSLSWLESFYYADDLPAGSDWKEELEKGVGSSLLIMLRTEIYDSRYWCQQEVLWSEEYAVPAVLVDARTGLQHAAATLPFDRVPTVRIPDGNLLRILFLALREGLRFLLFKRRVEEMKSDELSTVAELRVFSFAPGMAALLRACHSIAACKLPATTLSVILYPDPVMRVGLNEAAHAMVATYAPGTLLLTPQTLPAMGGITP